MAATDSTVLPATIKTTLATCEALRQVFEERGRLRAAESLPTNTQSRRDSIIVYLRRRATRWQEMAKQALTDGEAHVAERFAGAARLTEDAIRDLEADVDLMPPDEAT